MTRRRIAVLASGGGSNLQALINYQTALGDSRAANIVLVASDRPHAGALVCARGAGIATAALASSRAPDGEVLGDVLERFAIDLVVLAGYLQLVPAIVTRRYAGRMLNVHPAPLPQFGGAGMYGARVHRAVLAAGASSSGPSVHFVDEEYDHGGTLAHWPVPVVRDDDEHTLAARVLRAEHLLLPRVVQAVARGAVSADDKLRTLPHFDDTLDDETLGRLADRALAGPS